MGLGSKISHCWVLALHDRTDKVQVGLSETKPNIILDRLNPTYKNLSGRS